MLRFRGLVGSHFHYWVLMPNEYFSALLASVALLIVSVIGFIKFGSFAVLFISVIALFVATRMQLQEKHGFVHEKSFHNTVHIHALQLRNAEKLTHGQKMAKHYGNYRRKLAFRGFYIFSILIVLISFALEFEIILKVLYPETK